MRPVDAVVYAWSGLLVLCFAVGFPFLALIFLLFPLWHCRRVRKRRVREALARNAATLRYIEKHYR